MRASFHLRIPLFVLGCASLVPLSFLGCGGDDTNAETSADASTGSDAGADATSGSDGSTVNVDASAATTAVVAAANAFLASLTTAQQATAQLAFTEAIAETWTNLPGGNRNGPQFEDMSTAAQTAALDLAEVALSTAGYEEMQNIRAADDVIASTTSGNSGWGSGLTHFAILGTPSTSSVWMLQICQHHLVYNITYNGSMVSATPVFLGTEPPNFTALADGGTLVTGLLPSGTAVSFVNGQNTNSTAAVDTTGGTAYGALEPQRAAVDALATAILADTTSATAAKLSGSFSDVVYGINTGSGSDSNFPFSSAVGNSVVYPTGTTGRGVLYSSLGAAEQADVKAAIEAWVDTQAADIATTLLAAYESDDALAQTYIGYGVPQGATAPSFVSNPNTQANALDYQGSYLRIDGPRVLIEFVVQEAVAFRAESWVHYHSVWRDKAADYGAEFTTAIDAGTGSGTGGGMGGDGGMGGMGMPDGGMGPGGDGGMMMP